MPLRFTIRDFFRSDLLTPGVGNRHDRNQTETPLVQVQPADDVLLVTIIGVAVGLTLFESQWVLFIERTQF